jgi:hypothetical protein
LTVAGHLKGGTPCRPGVALAVLDGAGIEGIARDQTRVQGAGPGQRLLRGLLEAREARTQGAPALPQGAGRPGSAVRCKARESGPKHRGALTEISQALRWGEVISPPALLELGVVPPPVALGRGGQSRHVGQGLGDQPEVRGRKARALSDGGGHEPHVGLDERSAFAVRKAPLFTEQGARCAEAFSHPAPRCRVQKGHEAWSGDMAQGLHGSVFLHVLDHLASAEVGQSAEDGGGDQEAKGVSCASCLRVVERDEAFHAGLPRDNVAQEDQSRGGVGQRRLDPLVHSQVHFVAYYFLPQLPNLRAFWLSLGTEEIILTKH